jgi:hypothetical protein
MQVYVNIPAFELNFPIELVVLVDFSLVILMVSSLRSDVVGTAAVIVGGCSIVGTAAVMVGGCSIVGTSKLIQLT